MKINIKYTERKYYRDAPDGYRQWRFHFHRYKYVRGFVMRIFGWYFNVRENNATVKLIEKFKEREKNGIDNKKNR